MAQPTSLTGSTERPILDRSNPLHNEYMRTESTGLSYVPDKQIGHAIEWSDWDEGLQISVTPSEIHIRRKMTDDQIDGTYPEPKRVRFASLAGPGGDNDVSSLLVSSFRQAPTPRQSERTEPKSALRAFRCTKCGASFTKKSSLKRHASTHSPAVTVRYRCRLCNASFTRNDDRKRHIENRHAGNMKACPGCKKMFRSDYIRVHLQSQRGQSCAEAAMLEETPPSLSSTPSIPSSNDRDNDPAEPVSRESDIAEHDTIEIFDTSASFHMSFSTCMPDLTLPFEEKYRSQVTTPFSVSDEHGTAVREESHCPVESTDADHGMLSTKIADSTSNDVEDNAFHCQIPETEPMHLELWGSFTDCNAAQGVPACRRRGSVRGLDLPLERSSVSPAQGMDPDGFSSLPDPSNDPAHVSTDAPDSIPVQPAHGVSIGMDLPRHVGRKKRLSERKGKDRRSTRTVGAPCCLCGKSFETDPDRLMQHLKEHFEACGMPKHECQTCKVSFVHPQDLQQHKRSANGGSCGYGFKHDVECTGHHPPQESLYNHATFLDRIREWEQSQLRVFRASVDKMVRTRIDEGASPSSKSTGALSDILSYLSPAGMSAVSVPAWMPHMEKFDVDSLGSKFAAATLSDSPNNVPRRSYIACAKEDTVSQESNSSLTDMDSTQDGKERSYRLTPSQRYVEEWTAAYATVEIDDHTGHYRDVLGYGSHSVRKESSSEVHSSPRSNATMPQHHDPRKAVWHFNEVLKTAVKQRDEKTVSFLLTRNNAFGNLEDQCTASLDIAAKAGNESVVRWLLERGANVNANSHTASGSIVAAAAARGRTKIVTLLLEKGADPLRTRALNWSALHAAACNGQTRVADILLRHGVPVDHSTANYGSALYEACKRGHLATVQLLYLHGASLAKQGTCGTPLHAASGVGYLKVVEYLLEKEADVNKVAGKYDTPLQAAAAEGHYDVASKLLTAGANVNARGGCFTTAFLAAKAGNHVAVMDLLRKSGASET